MNFSLTKNDLITFVLDGKPISVTTEHGDTLEFNGYFDFFKFGNPGKSDLSYHFRPFFDYHGSKVCGTVDLKPISKDIYTGKLIFRISFGLLSE